MTRRELLTRLLGAAAVAVIAPLIDLTDQTPAFWNQPPLLELLPFKITFPDGATFRFAGRVVAEKLLDDGNVSLTVRPEGSTWMTQEISFPINYAGEESHGRVEAVPSEHAPATVLQKDDGTLVELKDIKVPELTRREIDALDDCALGTLKRGNVTFTIGPFAGGKS